MTLNENQEWMVYNILISNNIKTFSSNPYPDVLVAVFGSGTDRLIRNMARDGQMHPVNLTDFELTEAGIQRYKAFKDEKRSTTLTRWINYIILTAAIISAIYAALTYYVTVASISKPSPSEVQLPPQKQSNQNKPLGNDTTKVALPSR